MPRGWHQAIGLADAKTWACRTIYNDLRRWRSFRYALATVQSKGVEYSPWKERPALYEAARKLFYELVREKPGWTTTAYHVELDKRLKRHWPWIGSWAMAAKKAFLISYEFVRQMDLGGDKFDEKVRLLGKLHAIQDERQIGRLHTYYPGQRTELDYTKYGIWLFPTEKWNEPLFYYTGTGIDHTSKVIKGFTITVDPSARDAVRLYRNCVLPKALWLPSSLRHYAQHWDVFGIEVYVVVDNATDLTANAIIVMFMINGVIVLRMPPRRGDLKGGVERNQQTIETMVVSRLPGYVPKKYVGLDMRYIQEGPGSGKSQGEHDGRRLPGQARRGHTPAQS